MLIFGDDGQTSRSVELAWAEKDPQPPSPSCCISGAIFLVTGDIEGQNSSGFLEPELSIGPVVPQGPCGRSRMAVIRLSQRAQPAWRNPARWSAKLLGWPPLGRYCSNGGIKVCATPAKRWR